MRSTGPRAPALPEVQVRDLGAHLETDAPLLQPSRQRPDNGVVLVVRRAAHARQRIDPGELMDEPLEVALELDRAVPRLKREGRGPQVPEVGLEERRREVVP